MKFLKLMAVTLLAVSAGSLFAEGEVAQLASALDQLSKYKSPGIIREEIAKGLVDKNFDSLSELSQTTLYGDVNRKIKLLNRVFEKQTNLDDLLLKNEEATTVLLDNEIVLEKLGEIDEDVFGKSENVLNKSVQEIKSGKWNNLSSKEIAEKIKVMHVEKINPYVMM